MYLSDAEVDMSSNGIRYFNDNKHYYKQNEEVI